MPLRGTSVTTFTHNLHKIILRARPWWTKYNYCTTNSFWTRVRVRVLERNCPIYNTFLFFRSLATKKIPGLLLKVPVSIHFKEACKNTVVELGQNDCHCLVIWRGGEERGRESSGNLPSMWSPGFRHKPKLYPTDCFRVTPEWTKDSAVVIVVCVKLSNSWITRAILGRLLILECWRARGDNFVSSLLRWNSAL